MTRAQLFILVMVALVLLVNLLARVLRQWVKGDGPREIDPDTQQIPPRGSRPLPPVVEPRSAREGPHSAPLPRVVPPSAARRRGRPPVGSLRAVRRGIVLMTILGPCRALEPPAPPRERGIAHECCGMRPGGARVRSQEHPRAGSHAMDPPLGDVAPKSGVEGGARPREVVGSEAGPTV
jgi:hypothetical protein